MKSIRFSKHTITRCLERDITEETVRYILANAERIKESFDGRKIASKKVENRIITVVFIEKEKYISIVTVY